MPLRIYASVVTGDLVWRKKPQLEDLAGLDNARERVEILEKSVNEAYQAILNDQKIHPAPLGTITQRIFLAPEYFFSTARYRNDRFYNKALKWWILANLKRIAREHPGMLIIPGTVLWKEEALQRPSQVMKRELRAGASQKDAFKKAVMLIELKNRPQLSAMQRALVPTSNDPDEVYFTDSVAPIRSRTVVEVQENAPSGQIGNKVKVLDPIQFMKPGAQRTKMAYNTAYVCYGSKALEYHKSGNFQEVKDETDPLIYFSGTVQGVFKLGGIRYGLEICRDHAVGFLKRPIDIHLLTSSWIDFIQTQALLLIHSSTQAPGPFQLADGSSDVAKTQPLVCTDAAKPRYRFKLTDSTVFVVDIPSLNPSGAGLEGIGLDEPVAWWA